MTIIYGIKNCDSVKKARSWLEKNNIAYQFHDFRVDGINDELISSFTKLLDWQQLLNKRSTSYRLLADDVKATLSAKTFNTVVFEQPTLLKRPLLLNNQQLTVGFNAAQYQELLTK